MSKKKSALLLVDQRARDSQGILLVSYFLKQMGCNVYLCNKRNMLHKYEWYRPSVVAFSDTGTYFADWCRYMSKKSKIVLIPQEGAIPLRDITIKRYLWPDNKYSKPFTKEVAKVFLWGQQTAKWLLEENIFREEQVVISGTPRLDQYRNRASMKNRGLQRNYCVGFANRGESVNMVYHTILESIFNSREYNGPLEAYIGTNRNWEDWIWHTIAQIRIYFILIDKLSSNPEIKVMFRPDPFEKFKTYNFLKNRNPNFEINTNPFLGEFIDEIDILITEYSTTGIDALISGKPVISVQKIIGPRLQDHIGNKAHVDAKEIIKLYWLPETIEEALHLIKKSMDNELSVCPDTLELQKYLKDYYDLPRHEPSSLTIAKEIAALLDIDTSISHNDTENDYLECSPIGNKFKAKFPFLSGKQLNWVYKQYYIFDLLYIMKDLLNQRLLPNIRSEFYPWQMRDFVKANAVYQKLRDEL